MSEESTSAGSATVEPIPDGPIGGVPLAKPIHIQRLEQAVNLKSFLDFVDQCMDEPNLEYNKEEIKEIDEIGRQFVPKTDLDSALEQQEPPVIDAKADQDFINSGSVAKAERRADKRKFFNFGKVKKNRRWLKAILLSDSSDPDDDEEDDRSLSKNDLREMLRLHKFGRQCRNQFYIESELQQYQYYSAGLLSNFDKFLDHQRSIIGPKKAKKTSNSSKLKDKLKRERERKILSEDQGEPQMMQEAVSDYDGSVAVFQDANRKFTSIKDVDARRKRIWLAISKRDIPKAHKHRASVHNNILTNCRKMAQACQKELRRSAIQSQRQCKETPYRARRLTREMMAFWKHYEKVEKEHRRKAEKEAQEQRRIDDEIREAKRQQRKLNFLITQTELYAHFMSRKLTGQGDEERDRILNLLDEKAPQRRRTVKEGVLVDIEADDYDSETMKQRALSSVTNAYNAFETTKKLFDVDLPVLEKETNSAFSLSTPSPMETQHPQPDIFRGTLKSYQLKGMNWLANLYDCGINGILADEMGLGKTVQSIAFLAHLAESQGIWGPFLVIAPSSTLHNWTQECSRFVPKLRVLPYWGNPQDRKTLRKFWGGRPAVMHTEQAEFHVLVTSYQLVVQDIRYFQRIKWHYMILDEAQAIKSSSSVRWRLLLGFNCRNRLLLTGTPIQNSMAELWALLHFIMPTLFDSHEEFNDWFSKDIESHVEKQSGINEEQLSRLHMILKPFMLRRVKKDVENELSDKIEILMYCQLSTRQRLFYQAIKNKISIDDLLRSQSSSTSQTTTTTNNLMNLVMQFRKVCNHPELFERRETQSPYHIQLDELTLPTLLLQDGIVANNSLKNKVLYNTLSIYSPDNIHHSLFPPPPSASPSTSSSSAPRSGFSYTRLVGVSPGELQACMLAEGLQARWLLGFLVMKAAYRVYQDSLWKEEEDSSSINRRLLLWPLHPTRHPSCSSSPVWEDLLFTSSTKPFASHCTHLFHHMAETGWHKRVRARGKTTSVTTTLSPSPGSSPHSSSSSGLMSPNRQKAAPHASPSGAKSPGFNFGGTSKSPVTPSSESPAFKPSSSLIAPRMHPVVVRKCQRTELPAFLFNTIPKANAAPVSLYSTDRRTCCKLLGARQGDSPQALKMVKYGSADIYNERRSNPWWPVARAGLDAIKPPFGWSKIQIPDKDYQVTDSGKMHVLDELLSRLKDQGHRVLIYSQMTRMIDILEEFMWHRKHTYMRLDGSSKISDRRDMVAGFQTRSDIFVFLLSTRAGGLGINLTAADTVIFYDSDWNPTVDQQAMDRAHRLGQTKQVTVYRLICKGTIEEHILERAREKSEIQRMVITGGNFKLDSLKPKEVVSLLLDDEDIERKYRMKQKEKRTTDDKSQGKDKKRKRDKDQEIAKEVGKKSKGEVPTDSASVSVDGEDSIFSVDSGAPSPVSVVSVGSDSNQARSLSLTPVPQDENSSDGLVIVDDAFPGQHVETDDQGGKQKAGPGGRVARGKPAAVGAKKTLQRVVRPRKGIAAAAMAGARAGAVAGTAAAYAAYGFSLVGKKEVGTAVSAPVSSTPPPPPLSASTSPTNDKKSPSSQHSVSDTKPGSTSTSPNKLSPRPGTPSAQQLGKGPTTQTVSPKQTGNNSDDKSDLKMLLSDDNASPKKFKEAGKRTSPNTNSGGVMSKASPPTKKPALLSPSLKSSPNKMLSNHNSSSQKSQIEKDGPTVKRKSPIRLNSPLLAGRELTSQPVPQIKPGSSPVPLEKKARQHASGGLKQSPPSLVAAQFQHPRGQAMTSPIESRTPTALLAQLTSPLSKPTLSSPPLQSKPGSPIIMPLDLTPVKPSIQSPRRAKSPIASNAGSRSPRGSSPITKSPSHKSPGRHSPAQVAPLDLRAKPVVPEATPTSGS